MTLRCLRRKLSRWFPAHSNPISVPAPSRTTRDAGIRRRAPLPLHVEPLEARLSPVLSTWTGAVNTVFGNAANWSPNIVPGSADDVVISNVTNDPILDTGRTIKSLTLNKDSILNLGNFTLTLNSTLTMTAATITATAGALTLGGNVQINADPVTSTISGFLNLGGVQRTFTVADGVATVDLDISAAIGVGGIRKSGAGTMQFSGASNNSYTGNTFVDAGTLLLNKSPGQNAIAGGFFDIGDNSGGNDADVVRLLGSDQIASTVQVGVLSSGLFDLNGFNETISSLDARSGSSFGADIMTGAGMLTLNGDVQISCLFIDNIGVTIAGNLSLGGGTRTFTVEDSADAVDLNISAAVSNGGLTKDGGGTLVLTGANPYAGTTTVNAGELLVDGSTIASAFTVNSGGKLGGDGGAVGPVTVNAGGVFAPGSSPGVLNSSNAVLNSGAFFEIEIGGFDLNFGAATNFAVGINPYSVAVGDFNKDGKQDLATANLSSNNVSIMLGDGTGSFGAATNFAVGIDPESVAVGDFNGDGKQDLAAANTTSNNVSIILGDGTGSFGAATNFAVGSVPEFVAVGDFNGDGKQDLATANAGSNNVSILLGTGTGNFGGATNYAVGSNPISVAIGDFNGDFEQDVAVANRNSNNVSILLGTGTGSFSAAANFSVGSGPFSVAKGDFDEDGKQDLAVSNRDSNNVSILRGIGTGSFNPAVNFSVGSGPRSIAVGDFNGDGKQDLVAANSFSNNVSILAGSGTGSFDPAVNVALGSGPYSVTIGDFNRDGKLDLATANLSSNNVSVLLNTGQIDLLNVAGTVNLGGSTLNATLTYTPSVGSSIPIITNDLTDAVSGTFAGLPEGATLSIGGQPFFISYSGGDGNDVVLSRSADITVNSETDSNARDRVLGLREAILLSEGLLAFAALDPFEQAQVNDNVGAGIADSILFNIPGPGPHVITLTASLPTITDGGTIIDGYSEPDSAVNTNPLAFNGIIAVVLDGTGMAPGAGMRIESTNNVVRGINFQNISVPGVTAIHLSGSGADNNRIEGNLIGTNATGAAAAGNYYGFVINAGANNNTIGGPALADRNVISGNAGIGIWISNSGTTANSVINNLIGLNAAGTAALANAVSGILINDGSSNNFIGGTLATERNVISGNSRHGIEIENASTTLVLGNFIGTNATGMGDVGNVFDGIFLNNSGNNTIGGTTTAERNIISGNDGFGIEMTGSNATGNLIQGNYIGINSSGNASLANGSEGIVIAGGSSSNTIGGTIAGAKNIINAGVGVGLDIAGAGSINNLVQGNYIGTDATGMIGLSPSGTGILINSQNNNTIGGTAAGAGNVISGNSEGIVIQGAATGNQIQGNLIGTNPAGASAVPNNVGIRVDNGATFNLIGGPSTNAGNTISGNSLYGIQISGTGTSFNTVQHNQIGLNSAGTAALQNNSGIRIDGGATDNLIGGTGAMEGNTISGNFNNGITMSDGGTSGNLVQGNAIGTDPTGMIGIGNGNVGVDIVSGAYSNTVGGGVTGAGNLLSDNQVGVRVQGAGTSFNVIQGNLIGTDITGTGTFASNSGVYLQSGARDNTIGGTTAAERNIISGNSYAGIYSTDLGTTGNLIQGNYIGTDPTGTIAVPNNFGISFQSDVSDNIIGGIAAGAGNLISGNTSRGINFEFGVRNNNVLGNSIGTDVTGTLDLGNGTDGVYVRQSSNNVFGGITSSAKNIISGNDSNGIHILDSSTGNLVQGNFIGTDITGTADLGNGGACCGGIWAAFNQGVLIEGATNNTIGGATAAAGNVISGNSSQVKLLMGADSNVVLHNYLGPDVTGSSAVPGGAGVIIAGSANNSIGAAGMGNVISGASFDYGVILYGVDTIGNVVQGNLIGVASDGVSPLGNGSRGVDIDSVVSNNTIGGTAAGEGNVIAFNDGSGVAINASDNGNSILGNSIHSNTGLGIAFWGFGPTPNDAGDSDTGPNSYQNFPDLVSALIGVGNINIQGTLNSLPNATYRIEFFANNAGDPSGFGEGEFFLGFDNVATDTGGNATINVTLSASVLLGQVITATATDSAGSTSEFSGFVPASILVSGQKYNDIDGNGVKDGFGSGLSGWTIFLDNNNNGILDGEPSTTTNGSGNYALMIITPGTYQVREVLQAGWINTTSNPQIISPTSGTTSVPGVDFGNFQLGIISGYKFDDQNADGTSDDSTDPGLPGWTIFLDDNDNGVLDGDENSTITNSSGDYEFRDLPPGIYRVREVMQSGWIQTTSNPPDIQLLSAQSRQADFGNHRDVAVTIRDMAQVEGNSGTSAFLFTVELSQPTTDTVVVGFATTDGTATRANNDYQLTTGSLTFAPLATTATITVLVNGDTRFERNEAFRVNLLSSINATIADAEAFGVIVNDDIFSTITFIDQDDDEYEVGFSGPVGSGLLVTQDDPDLDNRGPIAALEVLDATVPTQISVVVTKRAGDGEVTIASVLANSLNLLHAPNSDLIGSGINLTGGLGLLRMDDIAADVLVSSDPSIASFTLVADQIGNNAVLGSDTPFLLLQANNIQNSSIVVTSPNSVSITSLLVRAGSLDADIAATGRIRAIQVTGGNALGDWTSNGFGKIYVNGGHFGATVAANSLASLRIRGGNLLNAHLNIDGPLGAFIGQRGRDGTGGSMINSTIAATAINSIFLGGDIKNSQVLAGTNLGNDNQLGGTGADADTFSSGRIGTINILGQAINSIIAAGLEPVDGIIKNGNDVIVGGNGSAILGLNIRGIADLDCYFAAGAFGITKINGAILDPSNDSRFLVG